MANVLFALRKTTTDALTTVSAATGAVTHGVTALSDLAEAGAAHSAEYRDNTLLGIENARASNKLYARETAKLSAARKLIAVRQELLADPELLALYEQMDNETFDITAKPSVTEDLPEAAE